MELSSKSRKDTGAYGESAVCEYLRRLGFEIVDRNVARKTGEIDIIAQKLDILHFVEVKSVVCKEFPESGSRKDAYDPSANLHALKIQKVLRTAEWYMANNEWEGESQIDAALVWLRERDAVAYISYFPHIL